MPHIPLTDHQQHMVLGILFVVFGISFCYKFWQAAVMGRAWYWAGFLPLTVISPFLIHLPPRNQKKTLTKQMQGMWVHIIFGPVFFVCAMLMLSGGADMLGFGGTDFVNNVISMGKGGQSITFNDNIGPGFGWRFPLFAHMDKSLAKYTRAQVKLGAKDRLLQNGENEQGSLQDAMQQH